MKDADLAALLRERPDVPQTLVDVLGGDGGGARLRRCALQVNPFAYHERHFQGLESERFADEASYNEAMVRAALEAGVEAIAITDHFEVRTLRSLSDAAVAAGLVVFPGFEAESRDGVTSSRRPPARRPRSARVPPCAAPSVPGWNAIYCAHPSRSIVIGGRAVS